jgi:hypothetical protein
VLTSGITRLPEIRAVLVSIGEGNERVNNGQLTGDNGCRRRMSSKEDVSVDGVEESSAGSARAKMEQIRGTVASVGTMASSTRTEGGTKGRLDE